MRYLNKCLLSCEWNKFRMIGSQQNNINRIYTHFNQRSLFDKDTWRYEWSSWFCHDFVGGRRWVSLQDHDHHQHRDHVNCDCVMWLCVMWPPYSTGHLLDWKIGHLSTPKHLTHLPNWKQRFFMPFNNN